MASGNQESEPMVPQEGSPHNSKDLERYAAIVLTAHEP